MCAGPDSGSLLQRAAAQNGLPLSMRDCSKALSDSGSDQYLSARRQAWLARSAALEGHTHGNGSHPAGAVSAVALER